MNQQTIDDFEEFKKDVNNWIKSGDFKNNITSDDVKWLIGVVDRLWDDIANS